MKTVDLAAGGRLILERRFNDMPPSVQKAALDVVNWASDYSDTESLADGDGCASIAQ